MKTRIVLFISLIVQVLSTHSQEFNWATSVSGSDYEYGTKILKDASGNTFFIGHSTSSQFNYEGVLYETNGTGDAFFAKLDPNKELIWLKTIGGDDPIYFDEALDMHMDPAGDLYLTFRGNGGNFTYDGQVLSGINSPGQFSGEAVLLKVDANGDYLWHDSGTVSSSFQGMTTDADGNLYLTGYFTSSIILGGTITLTNPSSGTTRDLLIAKYQPNGTILWAKRAGGIPHNTFAYGFDVKISPQTNDVIVLGKGDGAVFFDGIPMPTHSNSDRGTLLISYDTEGTLNWIKRVLDEQNYGYAYCESLSMSTSGTMGVVGYTSGPTPVGLVGFYNSDGSVISEHTYPSTGQLRVYSVTFNDYNVAYLSGFCYEDAILGISPGTVSLSNTTGFIVKMDTLQQVEWVTEFESSVFQNQITYDDGELLYAGRIDDHFIYNDGQTVIVNIAGDALFGEVMDNFLGVATYLEPEVAVYPNPTTGRFLIHAELLLQVEVYDIRGIFIERSDKKEIDLSQYSKGIYLVKIITNKGAALKKIILK